MDRILKVKHTADRFGRPLACIENMPGEGAEFSAANLRALAYALEQIADMCDMGAGLHYRKHTDYVVQGLRLANPFEEFRTEICGGYSTAQRLAALVKHLYNGAAHPVRLDNLLANADERHTAIALELIRDAMNALGSSNVAEAERIAAIVQPARDLEAALDRVQQNHAADVAQAQAAVDAAERERRLDDLDPMSAHLARVVGAPMVSTTNTAVPLNATANIIAAALGMTAA